MKHTFRTKTALAEQISLPCPSAYHLLEPVRILRKELGLTPNDLAVLQALISFLSGSERHDRQDISLTVVFPSNTSLSERANGIDERTLRRCLSRLATAQLISRKNSANGKRFPLRYNGAIRDAFGIDLKPLIQQYNMLATRASRLVEERERLRSLRAEALALRAAILQQECLDETKLLALYTIRNKLRRTTLTTSAVLQIIAELRILSAVEQASNEQSPAPLECHDHAPPQSVRVPLQQSNTDDLSGSNGQIVRQKESIKKEIKKHTLATPISKRSNTPPPPSMNRNAATMQWEDFSHVASFFPQVPQTNESLKQILFSLGTALRIHKQNLSRALQRTDPGRLLLIFDYLLAHVNEIRQPTAYFERILQT